MVDQPEKEELFLKFYARYEEDLRRLAAKLTNRNICEDLVQEIFLEIWTSFENYEGKSSLRTWAGGLAMNTAKSFNRAWIRAERRKRGRGEPTPIIDTAANIEQLLLLEGFEGTLREQDQKVLSMLSEGHSYKEISEATAVQNPSGTGLGRRQEAGRGASSATAAGQVRRPCSPVRGGRGHRVRLL